MAISLNESETGDKGEVFRDVQMSKPAMSAVSMGLITAENALSMSRLSLPLPYGFPGCQVVMRAPRSGDEAVIVPPSRPAMSTARLEPAAMIVKSTGQGNTDDSTRYGKQPSGWCDACPLLGLRSAAARRSAAGRRTDRGTRRLRRPEAAGGGFTAFGVGHTTRRRSVAAGGIVGAAPLARFLSLPVRLLVLGHHRSPWCRR